MINVLSTLSVLAQISVRIIDEGDQPLSFNGNNVSFGYVEDNCIYIILSKVGKKYIPFTDPFIFDGKQFNYFSTDNKGSKSEDIKIYRKFPFFAWNKDEGVSKRCIL